jgi:hypothetical protein
MATNRRQAKPSRCSRGDGEGLPAVASPAAGEVTCASCWGLWVQQQNIASAGTATNIASAVTAGLLHSTCIKGFSLVQPLHPAYLF